MKRRFELSGHKFGRLTVLEFHSVTWNNMALWRCVCDCGKEKIVRGSHLKLGQVTTCGSHRSETAKAHLNKYQTHGMSHSATYRCWAAMMYRCRSSNHVSHARYKDRGISVCAKWHDFENFLADMGERPSGRHSIERKNNNLGYDPNNCTWATPKEQGRNTCKNHRLTFRGETMCISEWAEQTGIGSTTIRERIKRGWSTDRSLTEVPNA